jgi:hypothetical protein
LQIAGTTISAVARAGDQQRERLARAARDAQAREAERREQAEHEQHAEQAHLFRDHRQDEVGVGLGQVGELLQPVAEPDAERPPRPNATNDCTSWKPSACALCHGSTKPRTRAAAYGRTVT